MCIELIKDIENEARDCALSEGMYAIPAMKFINIDQVDIGMPVCSGRNLPYFCKEDESCVMGYYDGYIRVSPAVYNYIMITKNFPMWLFVKIVECA